MQIEHQNQDEYIRCVDTVDSKDGKIKYQIQLFTYDDVQEGKKYGINVIAAEWAVGENRTVEITKDTTNFYGELEYETEFDKDEFEKAKEAFASVCDEFDPDKNKDLGDPNGKLENTVIG